MSQYYRTTKRLQRKQSTLTTEKNTLIAEKNALVTENSELKEENKELTDLVEAFRNCFKDIHTYADGFCTICGKEIGFKYTYIRTGEYIYFGEYPQTIKADDVIITDTVDSRGYYESGNDRNRFDLPAFGKSSPRPYG